MSTLIGQNNTIKALFRKYPFTDWTNREERGRADDGRENKKSNKDAFSRQDAVPRALEERNVSPLPYLSLCFSSSQQMIAYRTKSIARAMLRLRQNCNDMIVSAYIYLVYIYIKNVIYIYTMTAI